MYQLSGTVVVIFGGEGGVVEQCINNKVNRSLPLDLHLLYCTLTVSTVDKCSICNTVENHNESAAREWLKSGHINGMIDDV